MRNVRWLTSKIKFEGKKSFFQKRLNNNITITERRFSSCYFFFFYSGARYERDYRKLRSELIFFICNIRVLAFGIRNNYPIYPTHRLYPVSPIIWFFFFNLV